MARVFISYARADDSRAEEIRAWLHADGHEVFLDRSAKDGLRVGKEWKPQLYAVLRDADAVVCVVSPAFLASTWCAVEIAVADARGCLVLPLRVASSGPHPVIESLLYADYEADPGGVRARVLAQLREIDGGGRASWGEGDNPYPGLAAFTEASASVFFGRGRETRALADRIRAAAAGGPAVLALGGPSGCGKSSLLAAGLVPHLRADRSWLVLAPFTPSNDPVTRLVLRLTETGRAQGWDWPPQLVRSRLADLDGGLAELAADLLATTTGSEHRRLLIAVDQGEELFTQAESARVDQFFQLVRAAATGGGPVRTLVGLRSEFLDDLSTLPALAGAELGTFLLGPLDREMLALAIGQPARLAGLRLDPELTPALVADTGHGDALPLLAFTLNRLAEGRRRGDTITLADYHMIQGRVKFALCDIHYTE